MSHTMFPQTSCGTKAAWLKLVIPVGGVTRRTDEDRAGSGTRRAEGARVREALWTVEFEGQRISCELRYHGRYGVEYQLFRDNEFCEGRGFRTRGPALQAAATMRRQLENDGWSGPPLLDLPALAPGRRKGNKANASIAKRLVKTSNAVV